MRLPSPSPLLHHQLLEGSRVSRPAPRALGALHALGPSQAPVPPWGQQSLLELSLPNPYGARVSLIPKTKLGSQRRQTGSRRAPPPSMCLLSAADPRWDQGTCRVKTQP